MLDLTHNGLPPGAGPSETHGRHVEFFFSLKLLSNCALFLWTVQWYVVKVHSGREEAIKDVLERRVRLEALEEVIGRILIPVDKVAEIRNGRKAEHTRKLFSGYLLCEIVLDDRVLALFREIPGVTDFVRSVSTPVSLSPTEAARIVAGQSEGKVNVILPDLDPGDRVRILRGTFTQMAGEVAEVLADTGQIRVCLEILGRPVFLDMEATDLLQLARHD
jgi:transcriptional antiterminator NusG